VLSYSIHALLSGVKDQLTAGDLDVCLEPISEVTVSSYYSAVKEMVIV